MIKKISSNGKIIEYIKKNIIIHGNESTIYPRAKGSIPKIKDSNWILDFRKMFVDSSGLELISNLFWDQYHKEFPFQIASIELGSVPLVGALLLEGKKRGFSVSGVIVRKSRKKSGLGSIIEGNITGDKVILVDDLVNSGKTLFQSIEILSDNNVTIYKVFCIVNFLNKNFEEIFSTQYKDLLFDYLTNLKELGIDSKVNREKKYIVKILVEKHKVLSLDNPNKVLVVPKSSPLVDKDNIYITGEGGKIICIDKNTFKVKWSFKVNLTKRMKNILSSPVDIGNGIIFGSYDGSLYCLNKETGKQMFYSSIADWIGSTADFSNKKEKIYIGLEHYGNKKGSLACIDSKSGKILWQYYVDDYIHSSPIFIEELNIVVCGTNCGKLICLDADNGEEKWVISFSAPIKSGFKYIKENKSIVFGCFNYFFYSIDGKTGKLNWDYEVGHIIYSNPLVVGNNIFFGSIDRNFYHLDINGKLVSKYVTGGRIFAEPVLYKNKYVVFCSNDMKIYFYNIEKKSTMMYIQHSERITNKIYFENDKLYVLDFMNNFYLYDLSKMSYLKTEEND